MKRRIAKIDRRLQARETTERERRQVLNARSRLRAHEYFRELALAFGMHIDAVRIDKIVRQAILVEIARHGGGTS